MLLLVIQTLMQPRLQGTYHHLHDADAANTTDAKDPPVKIVETNDEDVISQVEQYSLNLLDGH